jgi:hypothetical protein
MRRAIVGVAAAACVVGVVGSLAYVLTPATMRGNAQNWRQDRLAFLKSTYDRIQDDITVDELDRTWATLCRLQDALALATERAKSLAD